VRALCLLLVLAGSVLGGEPVTGGYAGAYTRMGVDARSSALAGALVADINPGYLALTNAASTVYVDKREMGLSYQALALGRSIESISLAMHLPPAAAASVSYLRVADHDIQGRDRYGQRTEKLAYSEQMIVLTFAAYLTKRFSVGLNFKRLLIKLHEEDAKGFGVDLGMLYQFDNGLGFAVNVKNISGSYVWKVAAGDQERQYSDRFPLIASIGCSYPWQTLVLLAQADVIGFDAETEYHVSVNHRIGIEKAFAEKYFLRGGLDYTTPAFGLGMLYSMRRSNDSRIDYTLLFGRSGEGFGHLFTLMLKL